MNVMRFRHRFVPQPVADSDESSADNDLKSRIAQGAFRAELLLWTQLLYPLLPFFFQNIPRPAQVEAETVEAISGGPLEALKRMSAERLRPCSRDEALTFAGAKDMIPGWLGCRKADVGTIMQDAGFVEQRLQAKRVCAFKFPDGAKPVGLKRL